MSNTGTRHRTASRKQDAPPLEPPKPPPRARSSPPLALAALVLSAFLVYLFTLSPFRGYFPLDIFSHHRQPHAMSDSHADVADVVIVGGGLAGLSAAIEAHAALSAAGKAPHIVLLEKEKGLGGNSAKASSGMNGITRYQTEQGIHDSPPMFEQDTVKSGDGKSRKELVEALVADSGDCVHWTEKHAGITLSALSRCGGHAVARTHREPQAETPKPVGFDTIRGLQKFTSTLSGLTVRTNVRVVELLKDGSAVAGVTYVEMTPELVPSVKNVDAEAVKSNSSLEIKTLRARAVILATGGFSSDRGAGSLLRKYGFEGYATTNGEWATGDGVKMAEKVGVGLVDMECVQIHPTAFVDPANPGATTKFLAAEALRAFGAVLLDGKGNRFADELGLRDYLSAKIFEHCPAPAGGQSVSWMVLTEKGARDYDEAAVKFYAKRGFFKRVEGADELAAHAKLDADTVRATFAAYNEAAKGAAKDAYGKTIFPTTFDPSEPMYAGQITPAVHYTMGGALIDPHGRMLGSDGRPIKGLFGAGEVTGGVHGKNRLAGNSLLECVVFGRRAGRAAVSA